MNIGITISIKKQNEPVWVNGIKQNVLNLAELLKNSEKKYNVFLVNTITSVEPGELDWDEEQFPLYNIRDIDNLKLDLLFILGGTISDRDIDYLKEKHNTKVVFYKCGNEYILTMENIIFKMEREGTPHYSRKYDAFWVIPQLVNSARGFFEVLHNIKITPVPFIWSSMHIDKLMKNYESHGKYEPGRKDKRLSIFEPNIDVIKFALYPIFIAEYAYRETPNLIEGLSVTNALKFSKDKEFIGCIKNLDIFKAKKLFVEARYKTPIFLKNYTDIVISHQWENPLNYAYLDALYMDYPLVHNAPMIKEAGYYYKDFNIDEGAQRLLFALKHHDNKQNLIDYKKKSDAVLWRYLSSNPELISKYDKLIEGLF